MALALLRQWQHHVLQGKPTEGDVDEAGKGANRSGVKARPRHV